MASSMRQRRRSISSCKDIWKIYLVTG
jgi:hypothetical protein